MFQGQKGQKAALVARKTKSHRSNGKSPRLVPYCQYVIIILPKRPILRYFSHMSLLKAKIGLVGLKMRETKNNCKSKVEGHLNVDLNHIIPILNFLSFSGSQGLFWPLIGSYVKNSAKLAFLVV